MGKVYRFFAGFMIAILFLSGGTVAFADVDSGLLIASFSPTGAYVGEKTEITVGVFEVKTKGGSRGALDEAYPANNAVVDVTFTKGQQQIKTELPYDKEGRYKGKVKFPEEGEWRAAVAAQYKDHHAEKEDSSQEMKDDVFESVIEVKAPRTHEFIYWITGLAFVSAAVLLVVFYNRRRKITD